MSIKSSQIIFLSFILLLLLKVTLSFPFGDLVDSSEDADINGLSYWNNRDESDRVKQKRGCVGFPCVYTHMAERAGRASIERYIARLIEDCMGNPECNPGRRKRSAAMEKKSLGGIW